VNPADIPWTDITHLNHFSGYSGLYKTPKLSMNVPPYYDPPDVYEVDPRYPSYSHIGDTLRAIGHRHGVAILIDLGTGFGWTIDREDTLFANWSHAVTAYIRTYDYDGADFDFEGQKNSTAQSIGISKALHVLSDSLRALSALTNKKYYITCDVMPRFRGEDEIPPPDTLNAYCDQINLMSYDMYGSFGSPLYQDRSCGVIWCDSVAVMPWINWWGSHYGNAWKIGLGYNIQVYHTNSTSVCPAGGFGYISNFDAEFKYFPPAPGGTIGWNDDVKESYMINTTAGVKVAYEDSSSTSFKAQFIKRQGAGGAMGFEVSRGFLATPPPYFADRNIAVHGMGRALKGDSFDLRDSSGR